MKKLLSIILVLVLSVGIVTSVPINSFAMDNAADYLSYELNDDGESYSVSRGMFYGEELIIPSEFNGKPVTRIADYGFMYADITSITIPDSVTDIGIQTFYYCENLASIEIPDSVTKIDVDAFSGCSKLASVKIGNSVAYIGSSAFWECTSLVSIEIPGSVTHIGESAFTGCNNLTSVKIGTGMKYINWSAFYGCKLENIYVSDISHWCSMYFTDSDYGSARPNNWNLYLNDQLVTDLVIPEGVNYIEGYSFYGCKSITSVTVPGTVRNIGAEAFAGCSNLEAVHIKDLASWCGIKFYLEYDRDNCSYGKFTSNPLYYAGKLYLNGEEVTDLVIPADVSHIPAGAFCNIKNLKTITIHPDVTLIGGEAFIGCENLQGIYISDIGSWCNIDFQIIEDDWGESRSIASPLVYAKKLYLNNKPVTDIVIPAGVENIPHHAFVGCESLKSVKISKGVKNIYQSAFSGCVNLSGVTIPGTLENIYDCAFDGCQSLESIRLPKSVEYISETAFTNMGRPNSKFTIYGEIGSEAEDYADYCGFTFVPSIKDKKLVLKSVANTTNGVKITWNKVIGADSYNVYRKVKGGSWSKIGTAKSSATTYTDKTAKSGTTYYYTVRASNKDGLSLYNTSGLSIKRLATPVLKTTSNTSSGIKITWGKVTGTGEYRVYRKTSKTDSWKYIGKSTGTSYTDKTAKAGTSYYYTVQAYSGSAKSSYNTDGASVRRLIAPKASLAGNIKAGVSIKWNKITGASGYYVYRKTSAGDWKKIATVKGNSKIKYLDETPRKGVTYQYRVAAYYSKSTSAYSNTIKVKAKY